MSSRPLIRNGAAAFAALLFYGILTLWVSPRWALGIYQVGALATAAAWGISLVVRPRGVSWSPLFIPLGLVPLWGLAQLAWGRSVYRWETSNSILNWTVNFAVFFVAFHLCNHAPRRKQFLKWLLYFSAALCVISTVQLFTSDGKIFWWFPSGYTDFVLGPFVYKNQYAAFIETVLPLALYRGMTSRRPLRYWAMAGIMVASVVASASRAGMLLVIAEIVVIPTVAALRGIFPIRTAAIGLLSGIVLSAAFTAIVGWHVMWSRFQEADAYRVRGQMLRSSVQMVHDRPGMGFGLGTWPTAYPAYALYDDGSFVNEAHNDWAQWAVEGGLPLAVAMLIFALLVGRLAWKSLWGLGLVSVLLHCLVDYPLQQRPALAGWFFAIAGVLAAAGAAKTSSETRRTKVPE